MLQLPMIRHDKEAVKERLAVKHFAETELVDLVLSLDDQRKKLQLFDLDQLFRYRLQGGFKRWYFRF